MTAPALYRGRLAPSPTGRLHLGVARTSLITWLCARQAGGQLVFRLEDLDGPRVVPGAAEAIAEDLRFLGITWDEGFQLGTWSAGTARPDGVNAESGESRRAQLTHQRGASCAPDVKFPRCQDASASAQANRGEGPAIGTELGPYMQSQRAAHYEAALQTLRDQGLLFECSCSRKEVAEASRAPHGDLGAVYPGTCHGGPTHPDRPTALRFAMPDKLEPFTDGLYGPQDLSVRDDFIVRRADGLYAYQLAVVVDDIAMGITEVVRGADLLSSTPRQLALYRAFGAAPPRFVHVPLVLGPDGKRLAKRHGSVSVAELREAGVEAERIVGALAESLGLRPPGTRCTPTELLHDFSLDRLPREPTVLEPAHLTV